MNTIEYIRDADGNVIRKRVRTDVSAKINKGRTKQSFKNECDINNIVKAHVKKGISPFLDPAQAGQNYGFAPAASLQDAMNVVTYANQGFAELPSEVRNHFDNDPVKFVDFLDEPGNESQLQEWGLLPLPLRIVTGKP